MGHADLQMVNRYVKLLPQPGEEDVSDRLNDYLRARPKLARRQLDEVPRVSLHPALELGEWDQNELSAQHDLQVGLHLALGVIDAHAQRGGRFLSRDGVAGNCCERTSRAGSHLSGAVVSCEGMASSRCRRFPGNLSCPFRPTTGLTAGDGRRVQATARRRGGALRELQRPGSCGASQPWYERRPTSSRMPARSPGRSSCATNQIGTGGWRAWLFRTAQREAWLLDGKRRETKPCEDAPSDGHWIPESADPRDAFTGRPGTAPARSR